MHLKIFVFAAIFWGRFPQFESSNGERYHPYKNCVRECVKNCNGLEYKPSSAGNLLVSFFWTCEDDCKYNCMWPLLDKILEKKWNIPQFRGKWPFIRYFGLQEPASTFFSAMNLACTLATYVKFCQTIHRNMKMYWIWSSHSWAGMNAWFWSVLYHGRDIPFTEQMDYVSAACFLFYTFFILLHRIFLFQGVLFKLSLFSAFLFILSTHVAYLISFPYDYKYNMEILTRVGVLTGVITLIWCLINWTRMYHVRYLFAYVASTIVLSFLEMIDFPPIWYLFDAHALWHLSTIPLPYFLYQFVVEDCRYLQQMDTMPSINKE